MMDTERYIFLNTRNSKRASEATRRARYREASRRGIANWVVLGRREKKTLSRENTLSLWPSTFLSAPPRRRRKRGSRLVGVVHHRVNWRCSGHSVNPGRSITAKRPRCVPRLSARRSLRPTIVHRRRFSLSLSLSLLFLRRATPFRACRLSKKKAASAYIDARGQSA